MSLGPLELVVIGYEGQGVDPEIAHQLGAMEHQGSVRLVDLAFVHKTDVTSVRIAHYRDLDDHDRDAWREAVGDLMGLLSVEHLARASAVVPVGCSAVVALFEHTWATGLRDAVRRTRGFMLMDETLPREIVEELNHEMLELEMAAE